ncbi:DUF916 and DUF3324 domain-containing protein [Enterococcus ureasiticus]|uniref:Uncharacterized protein n=1 Tax=Enterococcus ureasiticus TaxID=903984 RepID=A0A1E5GNL2_9ENTE|nr:DUF916 and DUF3324 domain-containing protein [Enterococcus ureasiticus]OEG14283.1 hypothetical protein BCR21_04640 [Enterococcus ureasiticus]
MRNQLKNILMLLLFVGGITLVLVGQTLETEAAGVNYSVRTIIPDNQIDQKKTYFDLRMAPNQKQTVKVELTNKSDQEATIDIHIANGMTNINGVIDYKTDKEVSFDKTLKYPMTSIATVASSVKIPANETIELPIELKMPKDEYNGMLAGAIVFYQKGQEEDEKDKEKEEAGSMGVHNEFQHQVGLVLSENDNPVKPDLKLQSVKASQVNYRNVVEAKLQNPEPMVMDELKIEAKVSPKGSDKVVYADTKENMRMAPNSMMDYPIWLGSKPFQAGNYTLKLTATAANGGKWSFNQNFTITRKEADKLNKKSAVELDELTNWPLYIIIGSIVVIILAIIGFLIARHKINKAKQEAVLLAKKKAQRNQERAEKRKKGNEKNKKK